MVFLFKDVVTAELPSSDLRGAPDDNGANSIILQCDGSELCLGHYLKICFLFAVVCVAAAVGCKQRAADTSQTLSPFINCSWRRNEPLAFHIKRGV